MGVRATRDRMIIALEGVTEHKKIDDIKSDGGIILTPNDGPGGIEGKLGLSDRWARVLAIGPKCTEVQVGDRVLVTAQKWTEGFKHDGVWLWMTTEEHILALDGLFRETQGKEKLKTEYIL